MLFRSNSNPITDPTTVNISGNPSPTANFNFVGSLEITTLNQSGGVLTGSASVNVAGLTSWSAGTMSGSGVTNANGGMSLSDVNAPNGGAHFERSHDEQRRHGHRHCREHADGERCRVQ